MIEQLAVGSRQSAMGSKQPAVVQFFAHLFSYVFHPLFVPLYVVWFIVFIHPSYFAGFGRPERMQAMLIVILNAVFFPLFTVLLLKGLGFIESIFLKTQKDRIIPYIACGIFFFWTSRVFLQQPQYPTITGAFMLGVLFSSFAALLANIYFKISMHAIGMGGLLGIFLVIMKSNTMLMTWPLCIALLIAGLVCTSRLLISDHSQKEIYIGLALGIIAQFIAALVVA